MLNFNVSEFTIFISFYRFCDFSWQVTLFLSTIRSCLFKHYTIWTAVVTTLWGYKFLIVPAKISMMFISLFELLFPFKCYLCRTQQVTYMTHYTTYIYITKPVNYTLFAQRSAILNIYMCSVSSKNYRNCLI